MEKIQNITQNFIDSIMHISKKIFPTKIIEIEKKILSVEVVLYVFFGVLTTIVNIGIFSLLVYICNLEENLSNVIAIVVAVLFAYFSNKSLVFNSSASTHKEKLYEFIKFMLGRAFTMGVELIGFYLMFNIVHIPKLVSKISITIIVIVLNFFISKFFAFKKAN
ncbi:MAG: GtrA family protein [Clostridia bacterium]|nr:GtrA family protein [Clostridia bacterium]